MPFLWHAIQLTLNLSCLEVTLYHIKYNVQLACFVARLYNKRNTLKQRNYVYSIIEGGGITSPSWAQYA